MTELRVSTWNMPGAYIGPVNPLPPLGKDCMPHRLQDGYTRERVSQNYKTAVLENDHLRATFLLEVGGRLWSLVHKQSGRELLHQNDFLQPVNIALRGAWFSGGVEWNIGMRGHTAHTCSPLFAAKVESDYGDVLRLYEMERRKRTPYQIDFMLPKDSEFLLTRARIMNPNDNDVDMYWWSNAAVSETEDVRMIVPAEAAYRYDYGKNQLNKVPFPVAGESDDVDSSYPGKFKGSGDRFFCIEEGQQP
jgi:hypothetical protein